MTNDQLKAENADLRARLEEAEETLRAIREGEVDAVIVASSKGDRVFALSEAENLSRLMVETMAEAGLAVTTDGLLVFCNDRACAVLGRPRDQLLGHDLGQFVAPSDADRFRELLRTTTRTATGNARIEFLAAVGVPLPMHVWSNCLDRPDGPLICLVATDLTRIEADRELIAQLHEQQRQLRESRRAAINLMKDAVAARQEAERASAGLQASEQWMQQALRVSRSFTFEWEPATDAVLRSGSCGPILGLTGDEAVSDTGQRYFQRVHPDDRTRFTQMLGRLTPADANYAVEYRVVCPDGTAVVLEEVGQANFDTAGKLARLVGVSTDITAHKQAEAELARTKSLLETLLTQAPVGFAYFDRKLRYVLVNDQLAAINGLPVEAHIGQFVGDIVPMLLPIVQAVTAQILATGQPVKDHEFSGGTAAAPGVTHYWNESWYPVRDGTGAIIGFGAVVEEITARKRAEAALRRSQEDMDRAQAVGNMGWWRLDTRTNVLTWSAENHRIFGVPDGTPMSYEFFLSTVHLDDRQYVNTQWAAALRGEPYDIEHRILVGGQVKWVREKAYLEFDHEGQLLGGFGITQDITTRKEAQAALDRMRVMLAEGQRVAHVGSWEYLADTRTTVWSEEECRIYGIDPAVGSPPYDVMLAKHIHPDDATALHETFATALRNREVYEQEHRIVRPDGSIRVLYERALPYFDDGGKLIKYVGASLDITERKRAEAALQKAYADAEEGRRLLSALMEHVPEGITIADAPDVKIRMVSRYGQEVLGGRHDRMTAGEVAQRWTVYRADGVTPLPTEDLPLVRAIQRGEIVQNAEVVQVNEQGRRLSLLCNAGPIRDGAGKTVGGIVAWRDIGELKKAQDALRASERLYRGIGEAIDYGIWVCDAQGRNTYASESFLKLAGITQEQCSGLGWGDVLHPDDVEATIAAWKECVQSGGPWYREHRYRGADGKWHPILACGVAVRNDQGEVTAWAGINLDISRMKQAEESLQASLHEKEVLLKEVHHRVKNNLQVISSLVSLQAESWVNGHRSLDGGPSGRVPANDQSPMTNDAAQRSLTNDPSVRQALLDMFDDLRDRVRSMALVHEKLYQSENLAQVNMAEYATSLLHQLWRGHRGAAAVHLSLALDPVTLSVETAVPCGLILNELASNALRHAFKGRASGEVVVAMARDTATGRTRLTVGDTGVGLPREFDWRNAKSLGLRLVQMLAKQMGGTAEARKAERGGAEFRVEFPT